MLYIGIMKHEDILSELTPRVCDVAREVGAYLRVERRTFDINRVEEKGLHDYVSYVDREAERRVVAGLSSLLPGAGFITEEHTAAYRGEEYFWIIDPLDGTTNYVHDKSPYSVSIALGRVREGLIAGVVYDVCRDECFYAWRCGGAYVNGEPIRVSRCERFESSYVHIGLPYDAERYRPMATAMLHALYGRVGAVRICGSAAMDICNVAAGRVEAYIEPGLHVWDIAAGVVILREACGRVSNFDASELFTPDVPPAMWRDMQYDVLATNSLLHDTFLSIIEV